MDIEAGDHLFMKKKHPCGTKEFLVLRAGMDFKLRCLGCGREFMTPRNKIERFILKITSPDEKENP